MLQTASTPTTAANLVRPFLSNQETIHAVINLGAASDLLTIGANLTILAPVAFKRHHAPQPTASFLN